MNCRLCLNNKMTIVSGIDSRNYYLCENCKLINVDTNDFINPNDEKKRYLSHNNGIEYAGYVNFLNRAITPALKYLNSNMVGLDYGCGYNPTLSKILSGHNIICEDYDPFFIKNEFKRKYDFIFSTEVFEHFYYPKEEIEKLINLLVNKGILIIMTERWKNLDQFKDWYYARDNSHVSFYNDATFNFIGITYGFAKIYDDKHQVIILRKT